MQEAALITSLVKDTEEGLSATPKYLSSKYFYDKKGSENTFRKHHVSSLQATSLILDKRSV